MVDSDSDDEDLASQSNEESVYEDIMSSDLLQEDDTAFTLVSDGLKPKDVKRVDPDVDDVFSTVPREATVFGGLEMADVDMPTDKDLEFDSYPVSDPNPKNGTV